MLQFILWDVSPQIFKTGGFELRWYGVLFAMGFIIGQQILTKWYKKEGKNPKDVEAITVYTVIATVIGARLGHCLFYEPDFYLSNPLEILKVWKGGLASHGAAVGILIGLYLYSRTRANQSYLYVLDRVVILVAIGGGFIRMGNLMNSEIIGKQADVPWAFVFNNNAENKLENYFQNFIEEADIDRIPNVENTDPNLLQLKMVFKDTINQEYATYFATTEMEEALIRYEALGEHIQVDPNAQPPVLAGDNKTMVFTILGVPRHPTQVYESLSYFLIAAFLFLAFYRPAKGNPVEGKIFSMFLILLFGIRIFHEFLKENQVDFEEGLALNLGQSLSIPLVLAGIILYIYVQRKDIKKSS
jgi:prolipoprotein diacylglyceryltransferase